MRVLQETDGAILLDGDRGCGPGAPTRAMRWCIERACERKGMAVAAVRDWQLLVAAPFARLAAEAGVIGFACTNYVPLVAPPGGRTAVFGTNPFAYGLPAQRHQPVVLDIATTVSSMQKVRVATHQGGPMPEGVIFDHAGRPITDPEEFLKGGLMAPLGDPHAPHKGFGLALFIDALGGVLSGAGFARGVASGAPGNFLWALDVEAFLPRQQFLERMDAQIDQIKQGERLPGVDELLVPGERGQRRYLRPDRPRRRAAGASELADAGDRMRVADRPTARGPRRQRLERLSAAMHSRQLDLMSTLAGQWGTTGRRGRDSGQHLVGATGFEPATFRPPAECATRLRHAPMRVRWFRGTAYVTQS